MEYPRIAVRNARKLVNLNKKEEDIILKHMWGATIAPPKYKESYIVTMVDKYWAVKAARHPYEIELKIVSFSVVRPTKPPPIIYYFLGDNYGIKCNLYD